MDKNSMFQTLARDANERGAFNGAWLYAEGGEIVSKGALGFRDPEGTLPVTEDTVFQLASVSKTFTSAAVLLTVRRGLLSLEDKLGKYFPELTAYADVTVRQLLSHTGGVPDYFDDDGWFTDIWEKEHRVPGNDEIVDFLRETKLGPLFAPGDAFEYSNTGYNLLALLVERLSGEPYEEFLQKNIFEPAGMTSTRSAHIRRDGIPFENFARATVIEDGKYVADVDSEEDGEVVAFDGLNGDDYVFSTVFDMLKWDRALREGKVLTAEEQALAYAPAKLNSGKDNVYDEEEGLSYGLGWATGRDEKLGLVVSHSGGMPGVATWFERFIDADRTLVILTNRDGRDYRAVMSYFNGVEAVARDRDPEPVRTAEELELKDPDRSRWPDFCGEYETSYDSFKLERVWMEGDKLFGKASNEDREGFVFRLIPVADDRFVRKAGMVELKFADGCVILDGVECKKK